MSVRAPRLTRALLLFLMLAAALLQATPVSAHAELVRSIPEANARLDRSPARIDLYFSESVEQNLKEIVLYNSGGALLETPPARLDPADPTHLFVDLPALPDGVYLVAWKVISGMDAHLTGGAFPLSIGNVASSLPAQLIQSTRALDAVTGQILVKALLYLAAALLAGGAIFLRFVWQPAVSRLGIAQTETPGFDLFSRRGLIIALILLAAASLLGVLVEAGAFQGRWLVPPWDPQAVAALTGSRTGVLALARLAAVLALAGTLLPAPNRWNRWAALVFLGLALLTISLGSHAAAQSNPFMLSADLAHLLAASFWIGGLVLFLAGLWFTHGAEQALRNRLAALVLVRFSTLAGISLAVLVLTGVYQSLNDVGTWNGLFQTDYGRVLLVKLGAAAVLAGLGTYNHFFMRPQIQQARPDDPRPLQRFFPSLWFEAVLGAALLIWVGLFTSLPPANPSASIPVITRSTRADDLNLRLAISPARPGLNTFSLDLSQAAGGAVADASEVDLEFYPSDDSIPPSTARLTPAGGGRFTGDGAYLSFPDLWQVRAVVRRPDRFDSYADFEFRVSSGQPPISYPLLSEIMAVCILLAAVFAAIANLPRSGVKRSDPKGFQNI